MFKDPLKSLVFVAIFAGFVTCFRPLTAQDADASKKAVTDEVSTIAKELVKRRAKIDSLSTKIALKKSELQDKSRMFRQQRVTKERRLEQLKRQIKDLDLQIEKVSKDYQRKKSLREKNKPVALQLAKRIDQYLASTIPFKRAERRAEIKNIQQAIERNEIEAEQGLARLWSALEDEFRLTREVGLYRQKIELEGKSELVDVIKLGMVLVYFKALDGRVGMAIPKDKDWSYVLVEDKKAQKQISTLFESIQKRVRQGFFKVPNPYKKP